MLPLLGNRFGDFEVWHGVVPDLADAQVRQTYADFLRENFIRKGISGFKLDEVDGSGNSGGCNEEWQFPEFTAFPSGADGDQMRNLLGRLGAQAIGDAFRQENRRTLGLVRASQAWAAPVPMAIYSDEYDFPDYIRYNLSAGVQGLLWTPEVRDAGNQREWALRVAAAAFSARMLYNGWQFPHFPWQQPNLTANEQNKLLPDDNPYRKITQHFNRVRMMLVPYLYQAYGDYRRKGISPVRPLVADWPQDSNTWHVDDQWMLGHGPARCPADQCQLLQHVPSPGGGRCKTIPALERSLPDHRPNGGTSSLPWILTAWASRAHGLPWNSRPGHVRCDSLTGPTPAVRESASGHPTGKEISEFHVDELPAAAVGKPASSAPRFPTAGTYSLYIGKAHASTGARQIAFRNITVIQRPLHQDAQTAWSREVYLPEGTLARFLDGEGSERWATPCRHGDARAPAGVRPRKHVASAG